MKTSMQLTLLSMLVVSASGFAEAPYQNAGAYLKTRLDKLQAISCDKTGNQCVAVGFGGEFRIQDRFVYTTQDGGLTWSAAIPLASPKEEISPALSDDPNPASISCNDSGTKCIITSSAVISKVPTPIVYSTEDAGLTWSEPKVLPLPLSKKGNQKQIFTNRSLATSISCDQSGEVCVVAGNLSGDNEAIPLAYATADAGKTWTLSKAIEQPFRQAPKTIFHGTSLASVSCDVTGQNCIAAGYSVTANFLIGSIYTQKPVVYSTHDKGATWSEPSILPTIFTGESALTDISCDGSAMQCIAIGVTYDRYSASYQLISYTTRDGGVSWDNQVQITPNWGNQVLNSLRCDYSGKNCTAVGAAEKDVVTIPVMKPIVYATFDGGKSWEKNTHLSFPFSSVLNDVFCNDFGNKCIAVGTKIDENKILGKNPTKNLFQTLMPFKLPEPLKSDNSEADESSQGEESGIS